MSFRFRYDLTHADVAFDASGTTPEELIFSACEALLRIMIDEPSELASRETREIELRSGEQEPAAAAAELLHATLEKIVFLKDAEELLLKPRKIELGRTGSETVLHGVFAGEKIDRERHPLGTDVKGVTHHQFAVWRENGTWNATVVLDV